MKKEKLGICNIQPKMKKENPGIFIQNKKRTELIMYINVLWSRKSKLSLMRIFWYHLKFKRELITY